MTKAARKVADAKKHESEFPLLCGFSKSMFLTVLAFTAKMEYSASQ